MVLEKENVRTGTSAKTPRFAFFANDIDREKRSDSRDNENVDPDYANSNDSKRWEVIKKQKDI